MPDAAWYQNRARMAGKDNLQRWALEHIKANANIINTVDLNRRPLLLEEMRKDMEQTFTNLLDLPMKELTPEELALLAQRDPSFTVSVTTDDEDETDEVTEEAPAPTVH